MMKLRQNEVGIGDNLRRLRKSKGLTQEALVALLNEKGVDISRSIYSQMEINDYSIEISTLIKLKEIYKVSFNEFFKGL